MKIWECGKSILYVYKHKIKIHQRCKFFHGGKIKKCGTGVYGYTMKNYILFYKNYFFKISNGRLKRISPIDISNLKIVRCSVLYGRFDNMGNCYIDVRNNKHIAYLKLIDHIA